MNKKTNKIMVMVSLMGLLILTGCTSNQTGGQLKKESESKCMALVMDLFHIKKVFQA